MLGNLGISVGEMLKIEVLEEAVVLAGEEGLDRRVTKVNVMEVPDILNWVSEGEFLVTTAYSIKDNIKILCELIPELDKKRVSGLGIKVGRYINELPENIIEISNSLKFPIIQIPFNLSHTEIISGVLTEVIDNHMKLIVKMDEFNNKMIDIMVNGGSLKEITQMLHTHIGNTVGIYEGIYDSCEITSTKRYEGLEEMILSDFRQFYCEHKGQAWNNEFIISKIDIDGIHIEKHMFPIRIDGVLYGSLFIIIDQEELQPLQKMMIKSSLNTIALDFVKKMSLFKMEGNYKNEFIDDLLSNNQEQRKKALEKSKIFNFEKELRYVSIIVAVKSKEKVKIQHTHEIVNRLMFIVNRASKNISNKIIYANKGDRILILFGSSKKNQNIKEEGMRFCNQVLNELKGIKTENSILIGMGRSYDDIHFIYKSYEEADWIITHFTMKRENQIVHYDDLGVYKILCHNELKSELQLFCSETIEPLSKYDKENNSQLVETLKFYFQCDGNMRKLSQRMYVHYNTIIYRLQKISEITGRNLEDAEERLSLQLALKAAEIL